MDVQLRVIVNCNAFLIADEKLRSGHLPNAKLYVQKENVRQ